MPLVVSGMRPAGPCRETPARTLPRAFRDLRNIHNAVYNLGIYAQDEWRATPNLVLDFGIRVDRNGNPVCHDGCYSQYLGGFPDTSATLDTPYNATLSAGHDSFAPAIEYAIVQPRVGFNLDITWRWENRRARRRRVVFRQFSRPHP